jgi:hypothetical protein
MAGKACLGSTLRGNVGDVLDAVVWFIVRGGTEAMNAGLGVDKLWRSRRYADRERGGDDIIDSVDD